MNSTASDFSLQQLESRFEMQFVLVEEGGGEQPPGGGGGDFGYYGSSWDDVGEGPGYVGAYQEAGDGSGAMYDDGSYTDGSEGAFPSYEQQGPPPPQNPPQCPNGPCPPDRCKCRLCRCG